MPAKRTNSSNSSIIKVAAAASGAESVVNAAGAEQLVLGFDPAEASMSRSGNDLVFELDNGGTVVIRSFFDVGEEPLPEFVLEDGTVIASADLLSANGVDVSPAAATADAGGLNSYSDDAGSLIGGLDRLASQGGLSWGVENATAADFYGGSFPGGSYSMSITTDLGNAFSATAYEDARPFQHLGNAEVHAAQIIMNITPKVGSKVGEVRLYGFPAGAEVYLGDPSGSVVSGHQPLKADANGVYTFKDSDFTSPGVFIIPPANSDEDFSLNVSVDFTGSGLKNTVNSTFTVMVDAVADMPLITGSDFVSIANDAHYMSLNTKSELFEDGYHKQEASVASDAAKQEGKVELALKVTTIFEDYTDGSETHYVLVEKLPGFEAADNYQIYTDPSGKEYFMVPADGAIDPATGEATVTVKLTTPPYSQDTTFNLGTGSMAVETPSDSGELDLNNNTAVALGADVTFTVDVIDSKLFMQMGWASESNNPSKFMPSGTHTPYFTGMYDYDPHDGQVAGVASNSTNTLGAPIYIRIDGDADGSSAESLTEVKLTLADGTQGELVDASGQAYSSSPNADGSVTYTFTFSGGETVLDGVYFRPSGNSNAHGDVEVKYEVTVENTEGATATYSGASTIVIDAVADRATVDVATDGSQVDYNQNNGVEQLAAKPGEAVTLHSKVTFPDTDGKEAHFVLIEAGKEFIDPNTTLPNPNGNGFSCKSYSIDGGASIAITASTPFEVINGVTYYKIDVGGTTGTASVSVNVTGDAGAQNIDTTHNVTIGGLTTVEADGKEYDLDNNTAINLDKSVSFEVAPANSKEALNTKNTFESNLSGAIDPNKHGVTSGTLTVQYGSVTATYGQVSGYNLGTVGDITFSLTNGGDSPELFTGITFTIAGDLADLGTLSLKGAGDAAIKTSYDPNTGLTTVTITDTTPSASSITINFKPLPYSDADLKVMSYELDFINSKSHEAGNISEPGNGTAPLGTVVVDAVAAKAAGLTSDTPAYADGQNLAKPGEAVKVGFGMQVPDLADTNEAHGLTLKVGGVSDYNSVTLHGGTGGDLLITFDNPISSGRFASNVKINGAPALDSLTVELVTINGASYYKISGSAFESYLQNVSGDVKGTISFDATYPSTVTGPGSGNYSSSSTVGMLIEDVETDGSVASKNNASYSEKSYTYNVAGVGSMVGITVGQAFENALKDANLNFVSRAELLAALALPESNPAHVTALQHLKDGSARITVNGIEAGESISKAVFVADYPNSNEAPGQFMYKGNLIDLPADHNAAATVTVIDGCTITCSLGAEGQVTVSIEVAPDATYDNTDMFFVPAENYNHTDVQIDYGITVKDADSLQEKVFASDHSNTDLFPADTTGLTPGVDYDPDPHPAARADVDAVAQRPEIVETTVDMLPGGHDNYVPHGAPATVHAKIDLHGDTLDGTENHIFYVKTPSNAFGVQKVVVNYTDSNGISQQVTLPLSALSTQGFPDGAGGYSVYHKLDLGSLNLNLGNSVIDVAVTVSTPSSGYEGNNAVTIDFQVSAHEDWYAVRDGGDKEFTRDNNDAWEKGSATFSLKSASHPGFSIGDPKFYENNNAVANEGLAKWGTGVPLTFNFGDGNDILTNFEVSLPEGSNNADLGDLVLFYKASDYDDFVKAVVENGADPYDLLNGAFATKVAIGKSFDLSDIENYVGKNNGELTGQFTGKIIFMPDANSYSGQDPQIKCSIEVRDNLSGDTASSDMTRDIYADAVAQKPEGLGFEKGDKGNLGLGEISKAVTISATFADMDASTEHFVLVEAIPGWGLQYYDANNNLVAATQTYSHEGKLYYQVPVGAMTIDSTNSNFGDGSVRVVFTAPSSTLYQRLHGSNEYKFNILAGSKDNDLSGKELTFHNNTAISDGVGALEFKITGEGGLWNDRFYQISPLYEDNHKDHHLADGLAGEPEGGEFVLNIPSCGEGYALITLPTDGSGNPLLTIIDANGDELSAVSGIVKVPLDPSGYAKISVLLSDASLANGNAHSDADLTFGKVELYDKDGGFKTSFTPSEPVVVDAVADYSELNSVDVKMMNVETGANIHADAVAGSATDMVVKFTVNATFPDVDGSEHHYILVEKTPMWDIDGAGEVYVDGILYYRIDVTGLTNSDGTISYEVAATYKGSGYGNPVDIFGTQSADKGVTDYKLKCGVMTEEKIGSSQSNYETDYSNNVSFNTTGDVTLRYSPVTAGVGMTITPSSGIESADLQTITLTLDAIDTANTQDKLTDLSIAFGPADAGTLTLQGANGSVIATIASSPYTFTPEQLAGLSATSNQYKLVFTQNSHNHQDIHLTWSGTVVDQVSGASETKGGSYTMVMDAMADNSTNTYSVHDQSGSFGGVTSGALAVVTIAASFPDLNNVYDPVVNPSGSEEHWVVLQQHDNLAYGVDHAVIHCADGNIAATVQTMFGADGTPYFAVLMPKNGISVDFYVNTPSGLTADQAVNFKAGTLTVENTKHGVGNNSEPNYNNNWAESISTAEVVVKVGVLETEAAETQLSGAKITEDAFSQLSLDTSALTDHNETAVFDFTPFAGGTLYVLAAESDAGAVKIAEGVWVVPAPSITGISGDDVAAGRYYFKPNADASGSMTIKYNVTVTDNASGATATYTNQSTSIDVRAVADAGTIKDIDGDITGQGAHMATAHINVEFTDIDGSEQHWIFIKVPAGISVKEGALFTGNAATLADMGLDPSGTYYRIDAGKTSGVYNKDLTFVAAAGYTPEGDSVSVCAVSEELSNYANGGARYAASQESAITLNAMNFAPESGSPFAITHDWTVAGHMDLIGENGMFHDSNNDALQLTFTYKGTDYVMDYGADSVDIGGEHGTLTINRDGSYEYTPHEGQDFSSGSLEDFSLSITARDNFGGVATNSADISLSSAHNYIYGTGDGEVITADSDDAIIYGGAGNDTIYTGSGNNVVYGGLGDDTMHSGSGSNIFAWSADDVQLNSVDTIINFEIGSDKLFFEGMFSSGEDINLTNVASLFDDGLDVSMGADASHLSINYKGQSVELTLESAVSDDVYNSVVSGNTADAEAAKAALLVQILTNTGI